MKKTILVVGAAIKKSILVIGAAINTIIAVVCCLAAILGEIGALTDTSLDEDHRFAANFALVGAYAILNLIITKIAFASEKGTLGTLGKVHRSSPP